MVRAVFTLVAVLTRAGSLVLLVVVGLVALATGAPRAGADGVSVQYQPPVTAPIVDHFRPPEHPYGPGNRGIDYATAPGTPVRASAPGVVTFAGAVGGRLVVVIVHADTLRTTYDGLATIAVTDGQTVAGGDTVGTAGTRLHFGVRDGTTYLDPELLFAAAGHAADVGVVARLVPTSGAPAAVTTRRGPGAARRIAGGLAGRATSRGPPVPVTARSVTMSRRPDRPITTHTPCPPAVALQGWGQADDQPRGRRRQSPWRRLSPCGSCSRRASTSGTRPAVGTRR